MFWHKQVFLTFVLAFLTLTPVAVGATNWLDKASEGGLNTIGQDAFGQSGAPQKNLQAIIATIIKIFLGLLGIIFVVLLIIAGFKYMTAGGDEEKVKEAVAQIRNAVIGLLIVISAYAITYFITVRVIPKISG